MKVAILGYGVVGSGVAKVLRLNAAQIFRQAGQAVEVKYILDLRDFPGDPLESLLIKDFSIIERDPEIAVVVESIGGETVAYDFAKRALLAGKSVCTPNKALVAKYGAELISVAAKNGVNMLFEASVGGGIPLMRPFTDAMLTDEVLGISGILNGTSNYILTQMSENGTSYTEALRAAQKLGYAEQDPTADVGGFDACRKLAIMLSLATGKTADYRDVKTEGIENIGAADFAFARALGFTLKQIVSARILENGVEALTAPFLVPLSHPMAAVNDVYNAAWISGKTTGNVMFYGSGAGSLPTASAVVSNIVDVAKARHFPLSWTEEKAKILPPDDYVTAKVIRVACDGNAAEKIDGAVTLAEYPNEAAWISPAKTEAETAAEIESLKKTAGIKSVERVLRIFGAE